MSGCRNAIRSPIAIDGSERVVFVVDRRTDEKLLAETLGECRAGVYRFASITSRHVRGLMGSLSAAAAHLETAAAR
jgi:hypothetical protein